VQAWYTASVAAEVLISVLVIGEIRSGIDRLRARRDYAQADGIEQWLEAVKSDFAGRILDVTTSIAERWGALNASRRLPTVDGLIAATALEHDLTLVTCNRPALIETGVRLLDPWA